MTELGNNTNTTCTEICCENKPDIGEMNETFTFEADLHTNTTQHDYTCKGGECNGECQDSSSEGESETTSISSKFSTDDLDAISISPKTPPSLSILGEYIPSNIKKNDFVERMFNIISLFTQEKIITPVGYCEPLCLSLTVYDQIFPLLAQIKSVKRFKAGVRCKSDVTNKTMANVNISKTRRKLSKEKHNPFILFEQGECSGCKKSIVPENIKNGKQLKGCKIPLETIDIKMDTKKVKFIEGNYSQFSDLKNYIIYCDISNPGNLRYFNDDGVDKVFDKDKFIFWASFMSANNIVFINQDQNKEKQWLRAHWANPRDKIYIC